MKNSALASKLQSLCTASQWEQLDQYSASLTQVNEHVNLVSRKDIHNLWEHYIAPSFVYKILNTFQPGETVLDIGSGGGFPGIVNAILFPETKFVLVDSIHKKVNFLQSIITDLQLANTKAICTRVEDLKKLDKAYKQSFNKTTSLAVAPLQRVLYWSKPLLKTGGTVTAMKGGSKLQEELAILPKNLNIVISELPNEWKLNERMEGLKLVSMKFPSGPQPLKGSSILASPL